MLVVVIATPGSASQAAEPVTNVSAPFAVIVGHGILGGGSSISKSRSRSNLHDPFSVICDVMTDTSNVGDAHGSVP